jgi:hypothetical protein
MERGRSQTEDAAVTNAARARDVTLPALCYGNPFIASCCM